MPFTDDSPGSQKLALHGNLECVCALKKHPDLFTISESEILRKILLQPIS
jgi:hypothetical protein